MFRRSSHLAFVAAVAALVACAPDAAPTARGDLPLDLVEPGSVVATVASATARPGEALEVEFTNTVDGTFWFNPCQRSVQRATEDGWETLPDELRLCTSEAYILNPKSARREPVDVPLYTAPGVYRFVFEMRSPATPEIAARPVTNSFEVR